MQSQRLVLTQKQQLRLSPQMYQSLELLALPVTDLRERIQQEVEKNPALEYHPEKTLSYDRISRPPARNYDFFENSSDPGYIRRQSSGDGDTKQQFLEGALSRTDSLQDHLLWQLRLSPLSKEQTELGEILISNLDDNGFHRKSLEEVVPRRLASLLPEVLAVIREFDPPGVCVAGPIESLEVQAGLRDDRPEFACQFIRQELETLRKGKYDQLAVRYGITEDEVEETFDFIKSLNPYPASSYSSRSIEYVVPDITIRKQNNQLKLYLHNELIPELKIDEQFQDMGSGEDHLNTETRRYIQRSLRDAHWLMSSIEMRTSTLRKVGAALMKYQYQFFLKGPKHLRPMTLKHIAEEISVHETTVSRISHAKFIQTDWGIFPIKYFFSSGIPASGHSGEGLAKNSVKEIIREIIAEHTGNKQLSDQKIADILSQRGIQIARRTVAKYRKELKIESSFERSNG